MSITPVTARASVYALLTDGTTVEIRAARTDDLPAVQAMHEGMSSNNSYLRFFNLSQLSAEQEATRVCRPSGADHAALLALCSGRVVGVASYEVSGHGPEAEIAFAVPDNMHNRGIGTLLLEHLVSDAGLRGITTFTASVPTQNAEMQRVFSDAGLSARRQLEGGVVEFTCDLPGDDADPRWDPFLDAAADRERSADVASLRHVFQPGSVAVVGASRRMGTVGRAILHNIVTAGYQGRIYAVNPHAAHMEAVRCVASVSALPEPVDLAVVAVPAAAVPAVADECGRRGVKALVVITAGLDTPQGADLLAICRRYGMRLVGPNCFGIAVPSIGLDATFAARHPEPGTAGLVMQSGGLGFALADRLSRLGLGVSSFASIGNKFDISSNDMLMWWQQDGKTKLAVLYIESFGNPRKFARTARHVGRTIPVLTVLAGRSAAGQQAAASHPAAVASPLVTREALFQQAGIIATESLGELLDVAALLATQPVPAGSHVAIVSNVGGAGVLTADSCTEHGLVVHRLSGETRRRLHALVPAGGAVTGPVDTTATVSEDSFRRCLEIVAADRGVDAVIALVLSTAATGDLVSAISSADVSVPLAAVVLDQAEAVRLLPRARWDAGQAGARAGKNAGEDAGMDTGEGGATAAQPTASVPSYADPEMAAQAMALAAGYGAWRARPPGRIHDFSDVATDEARALIQTYLHRSPNGGWLPPDQAAALLACYGIRLTELTPVSSADEAVRVAAGLGGPVVLKADVPGLLHKTDAGAVQLDLRTELEIRRAWRLLTSKFGPRLRQVLLQPMISGGTEVIIGVAQEPIFGPLIIFGLGGVATDVLADHTARLAPLTDTDANELIHSIRSAPLLLGHRGSPAADLTALQETLLRISRLGDDLPEIAELDLNPVIAREDGVFAVDTRIRLTPAKPRDLFLRKLR
jgi:acyl-CoA synthetase (NDP forming)/GNAT superfamily N-acetyltransferase